MGTISPKVTASTLSAALVTLICWIVGMLDVSVPVEAQSALTIILVFVAGYFATDPRRS